MITWGICSAAMMLTNSARTFCALRFLLGIAEAGFFPGVVLYLTHWIPADRRSRTMALFFTSITISGAIGNPLAGGLMQLDGISHLHGWQWLFLLEGIPPVMLGIAILAANLLPEQPADAGWLTPPQRQWLQTELAPANDEPGITPITELRDAMDGRLLLLSLIYFLIVMGVYGFVYFMPTLIKSATGDSDARVGLWAGVPYVFAAISMVVIGSHADRCRQRRWHVAGCAMLGAIGLAVVAESSHSAAGTIIWLVIAAVGIYGQLGPYWSIPTRYLRGTAAAGGIAVINCIGNLGGFVAPSVIGWAKNATGNLTAGMLVAAGSLAAAAVLVLCVPDDLPRAARA
jgi:ACS family tartrate transporter-like MFS transporter